MTTPDGPLHIRRGESPHRSPPDLSALLSGLAKAPHSSFSLQVWLDGGGDPDLARPHVSAWLAQHGTTREAQFLLKSWLDAKGEHELVKPYVSSWLELHGTAADAGFLFTAWLNAAGDKDLLRPFLKQWLALHGSEKPASYVLGAWLKAKGNANWLESHVRGWMSRHGRTLAAVYLFHAWAQSNGNPSLVRDWAIEWLPSHREAPEAALVAKLVARQPDLPIDSVRDLLAWCRSFADSPAALRALCFLDRHLLRPEVFSDVVAACQGVGEAVLAQEKLPVSGKGFLPLLFASASREPRLREALRPLFLRWMRHPVALVPRPRWLESLPEHLVDVSESPSILLFVTEALAEGSLDLEEAEDRQALQAFFTWTGLWSPANRRAARDLLAGLAAG